MDAPADGREQGPDWEELSRVLVDVVRTAVQTSDDALTPVQLRCLELLEAAGGRLRVGDLAVALEVVASSASRLVDRLVALGLVGRRQAPASRREVEVSLTAAGRRALRRTAAAVDEALDAAAGAMAPDDRDALHRGLAALTRAVEARSPDERADGAVGAVGADAAGGARR